MLDYARKSGQGFGRPEEAYNPKSLVMNYPTCCGANIIHGFGQDPVTFEKDVAHFCRPGRNAVGMKLVMINHTQRGYGFDKILVKNQFEFLKATSNPVHNHDTNIYLYARVFGKALEVSNEKKEAIPEYVDVPFRGPVAKFVEVPPTELVPKKKVVKATPVTKPATARRPSSANPRKSLAPINSRGTMSVSFVPLRSAKRPTFNRGARKI